jgi:hypothetical protein
MWANILEICISLFSDFWRVHNPSADSFAVAGFLLRLPVGWL